MNRRYRRPWVTKLSRILSIGTYPVTVPRHGGQARVGAILAAYRSAGHVVRHLAIYRNDEYPEEPASDWNVHFTWPFINQLLASGGRTDVNAADFVAKDGEARERIRNLILGFEPDVIQLEQCWLWPMIRTLRASLTHVRDARIVYSSQNVEFQLIEASARRGVKAVPASLIDLISAMEMDLVATADLVVAVSVSDAAVFGATAKRVTVAPNGISPRAASTGQEYWDKELGGRRFGLFVGSAHPPNADGFMKLLGPSLGFLSPAEMIVVVGGVGNLLRADRGFRANLGLNLARCNLVGTQDPGGLSTFIEKADVLLAPITEGGGTNIKVAEALYNRKVVICTPKATRGYEAFLDLPFMLVRETPDAFKSTLISALRGNLDIKPSIGWSDAKRLETLLWSATLSPLVDQIGNLGREDAAAAGYVGGRA